MTFSKFIKPKPILLGIVLGGVLLAGLVALIVFTTPVSLPVIATAIAFAMGAITGGIMGAAFSYFTGRRQEDAVLKAQTEKEERIHLLKTAKQHFFTYNTADEVIITLAAEIKERLKIIHNIAKIKTLIVDYQSTRQRSVLDYVRLPALARDEGSEYLYDLSWLVTRSKLEHLIIVNELSDLALRFFLEGLISYRTLRMNSLHTPELFSHVKSISIHGKIIPVFDNFCRENSELKRLSEVKAGIEEKALQGENIEVEKQIYYRSFWAFYNSLGEDPFVVFGRRANYKDLYTEWANWKWHLQYAFAFNIQMPHRAGYTPAASAASIPVIVTELAAMQGIDWDAEAKNINATDLTVSCNAKRLIAAKDNNWRAVLGFDTNETLTPERVRHVASKLYLQFHPDKNKSPAAVHQFAIIGIAREQLLADLARAKLSNRKNSY